MIAGLLVDDAGNMHADHPLPTTSAAAATVIEALYRAVKASDYWNGNRQSSVRAMIDEQAHLASTLALAVPPGMPDHPDQPGGLIPFFQQLVGNALLTYHDYLLALAGGSSTATPPPSMLLIARALTGFVQDKQHEIRYVEYGVLRSEWDTTYLHKDLERGHRACLLMHPKSTSTRPIGVLGVRDAPAGACTPYGRPWGTDAFSYSIDQTPDHLVVVGLMPQGLVAWSEASSEWSRATRRPRLEGTDPRAFALTRFCGWGAGAEDGTLPSAAEPRINGA